MSLVLGADLSYTRTGLVWLGSGCVLEGQKTLTFPAGPKRLLRAMKQFHDIARHFYSSSDFCVIEDYAFGCPSRHVMAKLCELGGVFKAVLEAHGIDYLVVSPSAIKKHITGKGTADKDVVARELKRLHGISFDNDKGYDLSDAAACAVWGVDHLSKKHG